MPTSGPRSLTILLTGANSGLGHATVLRMIHSFLAQHPSPSTNTLTIIFTTRSASKSAASLSSFLASIPSSEKHRIRLQPELLDLCSPQSISSLASRLTSDGTRIDSLIFNAGMGAFTGIDWPNCFLSLAKNWVKAVTYPTFKLQAIGVVDKVTGLGSVFMANVFGHYLLLSRLQSVAKGAKVVWVSSLEAYAWAYTPDDVQGLRATHSYESSKRLTDILALSTPRASWMKEAGFKVYGTHPGICATAIVELPLVLLWCMTAAFYIARWLGSPWHTCSSYEGARSMAWLALAEQGEEGEEPKRGIKWGSAMSWGGRGYVRETEVEGWGPEVEERTWSALEELRIEWEGRLRQMQG